jgi:Transposase DNA-binding
MAKDKLAPTAFSEFKDWAEQEFGQTVLGDRRRTARAVLLGAALAANPDASLPTQTGEWSQLKAAYRLLAQESVTQEALTAPHRLNIRQQAQELEGVVLFLQDTTEMDFSSHPKTQGLGHIGNSRGKGFLLHNCLAIVPDVVAPDVVAPKVLGLAGQSVWTRESLLTSTETRAQRNKRRTEADIWAETLEQIGKVPADCSSTWVSVGDRGSDIISYVQRARSLGWHCLIRVSHNRVIQTPDSPVSERLLTCLRALPPATCQQITLRGRDGLAQREVTLQIAWQEAQLRIPAINPCKSPVSGWYVRCWEEKSPDSENKFPDSLEWILFTTLGIESEESACEILSWYAHRWLLEEYHKCLKTGCSMEDRQLQSVGALKALLGFLSLVSLRLLQLRWLSRQEPNRPAVEVVPRFWLDLLAARRGLASDSVSSLSISSFWRMLAQLGGFIDRKSDGSPGWQTLWRGWFRFQDMLWATAWAGGEQR